MITWRDTEDIAIALSERHPDLDPLAVRFTDLHRFVTELPGFTDDPKASKNARFGLTAAAYGSAASRTSRQKASTPAASRPNTGGIVDGSGSSPTHSTVPTADDLVASRSR